MPKDTLVVGLAFLGEVLKIALVERSAYGEIAFDLQPAPCARHDGKRRDAEVDLRDRACVGGEGQVA